MNMLRQGQVIGECDVEDLQRCTYSAVFIRKRWRLRNVSRFSFGICKHDLGRLETVDRETVFIRPLLDVLNCRNFPTAMLLAGITRYVSSVYLHNMFSADNCL